MPVQGSKGRGTYSFSIHKDGGPWRFQRAVLEAGGTELDVLRCAPRGGTVVSPHRYVGQVTQSIGPAPVAVGAACEVRLGPNDRGSRPHICKLVIDCGGKRLYGKDAGSGYLECSLDPGPGTPMPVAEDRDFTDQGGDPAIDLRARAGTLTISDRDPGGIWTVSVRLGRPAGH